MGLCLRVGLISKQDYSPSVAAGQLLIPGEQ
jgi:hypothetical protein